VIDLRNRDAAVPSAFCRCGGQKWSSSGNRGASTTTEVPTTMHNEALTQQTDLNVCGPDTVHAKDKLNWADQSKIDLIGHML